MTARRVPADHLSELLARAEGHPEAVVQRAAHRARPAGASGARALTHAAWRPPLATATATRARKSEAAQRRVAWSGAARGDDGRFV